MSNKINITSPLKNEKVIYSKKNKEEIANKSLSFFDNLLKESNDNLITSPICFSLCMAAYLLSSTNDMSALNNIGIKSKDDVKKLIESLNWQLTGISYEYDANFHINHKETTKKYIESKIASLIVNQIIDDNNQLTINDEFVNQLASLHISTIQSEQDNTVDDISQIIEKKIGKKLDIPNYTPEILPAICTVSALYLKDSKQFENEVKLTFNGKTKKDEVLATKDELIRCKYYENEIYDAFKIPINETDLIFVLPKENHSLDEICLTQAYSNYLNSDMVCNLTYTVPFFKLANNEDLDLTKQVQNIDQGCKSYSLLVNGFKPDGITVLQKNKFDFNRSGVEGESVTACIAIGCCAPIRSIKEKHIIVDRPFYVLSLYNSFPLFAMKVLDIKQ